MHEARGVPCPGLGVKLNRVRAEPAPARNHHTQTQTSLSRREKHVCVDMRVCFVLGTNRCVCRLRARCALASSANSANASPLWHSRHAHPQTSTHTHNLFKGKSDKCSRHQVKFVCLWVRKTHREALNVNTKMHAQRGRASREECHQTLFFHILG